LAALQVFAGFVDIKEGKTSDGNWEASARQIFFIVFFYCFILIIFL